MKTKRGMLQQNLRRARMNAGMSQAQLADVIGAPSSAISCWECGRYKPNQYAIRMIAKATGVTIEDITGDKLIPNKISNITLDRLDWTIPGIRSYALATAGYSFYDVRDKEKLEDYLCTALTAAAVEYMTCLNGEEKK